MRLYKLHCHHFCVVDMEILTIGSLKGPEGLVDPANESIAPWRRVWSRHPKWLYMQLVDVTSDRIEQLMIFPSTHYPKNCSTPCKLPGICNLALAIGIIITRLTLIYGRINTVVISRHCNLPLIVVIIVPA